MRKLLLLILLIGCIVLIWDVYFAPHTLPNETTLTSKEGVQLDARIIRASRDEVTFILLENGREYSVPTSQLDLGSRYKVLRLANKEQAPQAEVGYGPGPRSAPGPGSAGTPAYLLNLQAQIAANDKKIAALEAQRVRLRLEDPSSADKMTARERGLQREIDLLFEENNRYQNRIQEIHSRGH